MKTKTIYIVKGNDGQSNWTVAAFLDRKKALERQKLEETRNTLATFHIMESLLYS